MKISNSRKVAGSSATIFYRKDNKLAKKWEKKIHDHLKKVKATFLFDSKKPEAVIILGGDGTILEAVRKFGHTNPLFLGLNLGHVGFLASVRDEVEFLPAIQKFLEKQFSITERMTLVAEVFRNKQKVYSLIALNDVSVQSLLGMVKLSVSIDGHPLQHIHGTGVLVATATGSTAFNLSAHGPIIMPDIRCFILTELMDHNIPTPPIVVKQNQTIEILVEGFRKRGLLLIQKGGTPVDVVLSSDGESIFPLQEKDIIRITDAKRLARFVEFEDNYFFKSLEEKFAFH